MSFFKENDTDSSEPLVHSFKIHFKPIKLTREVK
jgi:hypothetical protein